MPWYYCFLSLSISSVHKSFRLPALSLFLFSDEHCGIFAAYVFRKNLQFVGSGIAAVAYACGMTADTQHYAYGHGCGYDRCPAFGYKEAAAVRTRGRNR